MLLFEKARAMDSGRLTVNLYIRCDLLILMINSSWNYLRLRDFIRPQGNESK